MTPQPIRLKKQGGYQWDPTDPGARRTGQKPDHFNPIPGMGQKQLSDPRRKLEPGSFNPIRKGSDINPKIEAMMKFDRDMDAKYGVGWREKLRVDKAGGPSFGSLLRAYQSGEPLPIRKGNDMRGKDDFGSGLSKITHPIRSGYQAGAGLVEGASDSDRRARLHRALDHVLDSAKVGDVDFATGPGGVHPIRNSKGYSRSKAGEPPKKRRSKKGKGKKK